MGSVSRAAVQDFLMHAGGGAMIGVRVSASGALAPGADALSPGNHSMATEPYDSARESTTPSQELTRFFYFYSRPAVTTLQPSRGSHNGQSTLPGQPLAGDSASGERQDRPRGKGRRGKRNRKDSESGHIGHNQPIYTRHVYPLPTNEPNAFDKFTLFPKLPAELRLRVWKFALPGPRVVKLRAVQDTSNQSLRPLYKSVTIPPAGLFACLDSRTEFLKTFQLLPTSGFCISSRSGARRVLHHDAPIYFAYGRDTLELPGREMINDRSVLDHDIFAAQNDENASKWLAGPLQNTTGISRLRINVDGWTSFGESKELCLKVPWIFRDIESVTLFTENSGMRHPDFIWEMSLTKANDDLNTLYPTLCHRWKTVPYDSSGQVTPRPEPFFTLGSDQAYVNADPEIDERSLVAISTQELVLIVNEGIAPADLVKHFNKTYYSNDPFDNDEFFQFNDIFEHFYLAEDGLLKQKGEITLVLEWA